MEDSHSQYPEFISKGSLVEVASEEEGFGGAWFEATVITPPKKKKKSLTHKDKVHVQYKTLCSDENLSFPLREYVDVHFVRPPPPLSDNKVGFELYDVVDAFYKDAWWTGVITRIFQGLRFVVTFQNPPDELEFSSSDLRLHLDWENNSWVSPPKQKIAGLMFGVGKTVEVSIKIKNNQDVWYPATIVQNYVDSSFLVKYLTLKEGTEETDTQEVTVDCSHIRPSPPRLKYRLFELLEKVDAFHELGWWTGLITKELPYNRYTVFFQSMKRDGEFEYSDIRPQLNWKDGKWWFTSSHKEVTPSQENPESLVDSELNDISSGRTCKSKVISKGKKKEQKARINPWEILNNSPCIPGGVSVGTNLEETEFHSSSLGDNQTDHVDLGHERSHGVASSPKKANHTVKITMHLEEQLKRGVEAATTLSRTSSQQNTAMTAKENGGRNITSGSPPSNGMLIDVTSQDQPSDNPGMRTPKKRKKMDAKEKHTLSSRRKPGQGEESNSGFTKGAELVERGSGGKQVGIAFILGLECCKSSCSKAGKTCINNGEESLKLEGGRKKQLSNLPEQDKGDQSEVGKSSQKRKRGRPKKVLAGSPNAEMTEQKRVAAHDDLSIKDSSMSEVDSHVAPDPMLMSMRGLLPAEKSPVPIDDCLRLVCATYHRKDSVSTIRKSSSRTPTDSNDQAVISEHERQTKKAKRRTSENTISQISDSSGGTVAKTSEPFCITKEASRTVQQEPGMLDDQPLSTWFEKRQSPGTVNSSTPGDSTAMVEQSIELRQAKKELNGQTTPGKDNKTDAVVIEKVDAQNHVLVDGDTAMEQSVKLRQARKELNEQPNLPKDKIAVSMGEDIDERNRVPVDGDASIATTGEPDLPFVKNSSLWTLFESMEAFRKMPQKPHFRPLQQYKESSREGYAIAFMVNFSSAVEKISCLRFDDTREKMDDILDSLKDLESHGFGVQVLRDRITELESIKEKHKKLLEDVDVINKDIISCNFDKFDQDREISELTKQMTKLKEMIGRAEAMKDMKDRELEVLESRRQTAEETIGLARSRYEDLASGVL